jgi:Lar family restriction alleviation protein
MKKRKPCPFCGNKWVNDAIGHTPLKGEYRQCLCNTCGAEGEKFYINQFECKNEIAAKRKAIKAWNTRKGA